MLAIQIASWFALRDTIVYVSDKARQYSSRYWLKGRPKPLASIRYWETTGDEFDIPPGNFDFAVLPPPVCMGNA